MDEVKKVSQVGIVVRDMHKTIELYHKTLGWGPWSIYVCKPPRHTDTILRGRRVNYTMQLAETRLGSMLFEIIEPLEGPSIYKEFLEEKGEGLHHIACFKTRGLNDTVARFEQMGVEILMSGKIDSVRYCYMNTEPLLKIIYETGNDAELAQPDSTYP